MSGGVQGDMNFRPFFFFKQKTAYEIGLGIPAEPLFRSNLIQRNQSAAFSSGKVRPNHETNINIIARRTGKDVNSHTVLDGIIIARRTGKDVNSHTVLDGIDRKSVV